jgi:Ceramidase
MLPLRAATLTLLVIGATITALLLMQPFNAALPPATCMATNCFCEAARSGQLMLQPANSWSSFGYVFAGFLLMLDAQQRKRETAFPIEGAIMFGIAAITVGTGSVLLHATLTLWGQFADVLGMYLVGGFSLVYAIARIASLSRAQAALLYAVICTILIAVLLAIPEVRRWLFFVLLLAALLIELIFARPLRPGVIVRFLILGALVKALGFAVWSLDQKRILCAADSLVQGHAFWHFCGAVSLWLTYCYFRSERPANFAVGAVDIRHPAA